MGSTASALSRCHLPRFDIPRILRSPPRKVGPSHTDTRTSTILSQESGPKQKSQQKEKRRERVVPLQLYTLQLTVM